MFRPRLSYANVTATLALFLALGGTSYAAVTITGKNVKDGTIGTADVKDRNLLAKDFKPGQLPAGARGSQGLQGSPGPQGPQGLQGQPGTPGTPGGLSGANVARVNGNIRNVTQDLYWVSTAQCPSGQRVISGGFFTGLSKAPSVLASRPTDDNTGWEAHATGSSGSIQAIAYCVSA